MSMSDPAAPRGTPLRAVHESLGATMTAFAGWLMPLRYAGEISEHRCVRNAAGLFDLSHMGEIAVTGPDAGAALDYALTGDLSGLAPGRARYTLICAPDGGVLRVGGPSGAGFIMEFGSSSSVLAYLPALGDAKPLDSNLLDPTDSVAFCSRGWAWEILSGRPAFPPAPHPSALVCRVPVQ